MPETAPVTVAELVERLRNVRFERIKHLWEGAYWTPLTVIFDGTHPDTGERIHVVEGALKPQLLRNALVLGELEFKEAKEFLDNE